ncbi:MAG: AmmeMemoRadiSam system protein A [archaeon]
MEKEDQQELLKLARNSIETYFKHSDPDTSSVLHLNKKQGVFVTLHKQRDLRGCIGYIETNRPLFKSVIDAARAAAFGDPRFPVVMPDELRNIHIEISVLTIPETIEVKSPKEYKEKIKLGKDGLIIRNPMTSGLLLPQVATEHHFTVIQFLNALCQKAGLSFNAWEDLNNEILSFQAEIFSE